VGPGNLTAASQLDTEHLVNIRICKSTSLYGVSFLVLSTAGWLNAGSDVRRGGPHGIQNLQELIKPYCPSPKDLQPPLREGETLADRYLTSKEWINSIDEFFSFLAKASRVSPDEVQAFHLVERSVRDPSSKISLTRKEYDLAQNVRDAKRFRYILATLLYNIEDLKDRCLVPLVAPLLAETAEIIDESDFTVNPPQIQAVEFLKKLSKEGIIDSSMASESSLDKWRNWWSTNRATFPDVPNALRALEQSVTGSNKSKGTNPSK
jgi:hypothetical protein